MIENVQRGNKEEAEAFRRSCQRSAKKSSTSRERVGYGNAFTNANIVMDHFFLRTVLGCEKSLFCLYSGKRLPTELIEAAGAALKRHGLMLERGYL